MYTSLNIHKNIIRFLIALPLIVGLVSTSYIPISASFRSEKIGFYDFMPDAAGSEGSPFKLEEDAWAKFKASEFNDGSKIETFIQQSVLSPNHTDGEPHSVVSLMHERHTMMHIFLADTHREWERHLLNKQQISNLDHLRQEIVEQLNKQRRSLQEVQETLEKKLEEIEGEKQKLRERYGQGEQAEDLDDESGQGIGSIPRQHYLQEEMLLRQKEEDYISKERYQHERIDLITSYLNKQLELVDKHQAETDRVNKLERFSIQAKENLTHARQAGEPDPTQDDIDRKTQELLEAEHQREQEGLIRDHQQELEDIEEEERVAVTERQQRAQTGLVLQQQDEITIVRARDRYKREIILISKRQEERSDLIQQQILEEFVLKHQQEKAILIHKQRQRDQLALHQIQLQLTEGGDLIQDQRTKMLVGLYENSNATLQQEWSTLIATQEQQVQELIVQQQKQQKALIRKNKAYETIFEDIANNDLTRSLILCTKAIRSNIKGKVDIPDAKGHLTTIVKTLGLKKNLRIVEGYNLALAILHRQTNWSEVLDTVEQLRGPNFPLDHDDSLKGLHKKELKKQIKEKAFEALKVSADRGFVPAMSLLSVIYNKSNYRWLITKLFTFGIKRNRELLGQILPNPARAAELARIAGFLGGDPAALLSLSSLSARGLSGVHVAIRDERLLAEYQYVLAALALVDDRQLYLKKRANDIVAKYTTYVKTFQGFQEAADIVAKFAKTANDLNTIASAFSGMPTSILRGAHLGTTTSSTLTNAPTGATTAVTISRV